LAIKNGIEMFLRTENPYGDCDGMILNTLGELASIYSLADFAFVGGSLVPKRGHNPLEPAAKGKVVLFGPHMEDFIDIVTDMLRTNIAIQVNDENDLERQIKRLLSSRETLASYSNRASEFVQERQGVTKRHIDLIREVI
jgi:3-deoxy-D-manno-octulosonic-acid transferase